MGGRSFTPTELKHDIREAPPPPVHRAPLAAADRRRNASVRRRRSFIKRPADEHESASEESLSRRA
ncbi:hypothetical protein EYF80_065100 [Liparis tanakae]|uniref:Uncharacterized protein n=1 Tax=Liparis tanakae TaxID=230148 RepID=A0A4Z2E8B1_9TELE|nr:hypothetical protein EYF80_065100 [Liparis tanakae]